MDGHKLPVDIQLIILNEISSRESWDVENGRWSAYKNRQTWTDIVRCQLVCRTWKQYLTRLLPKHAPVHVVVNHAEEPVALKAIQLFIESAPSRRTIPGYFALWETSDQRDLVQRSILRNFSQCIELLLSQIPEEQRETFWKKYSQFTCNFPHYAAERGHTASLKILSSYGLQFDYPNADEETPLDLAIDNSHVDTVRFMIEWSSQHTHLEPPPKLHLEFGGHGGYIASLSRVPMMQFFMESEFGFHSKPIPLKSLFRWSLMGKNFDTSMFLIDVEDEGKITGDWGDLISPIIRVAPPRVLRRIIDAYAKCKVPFKSRSGWDIRSCEA